jgi:hypothetical protein
VLVQKVFHTVEECSLLKEGCVCDVSSSQVEMVHKLEKERKSAASAKAAEGQQIKSKVKSKEEQLLLTAAETKIPTCIMEIPLIVLKVMKLNWYSWREPHPFSVWPTSCLVQSRNGLSNR